MGKFDHVLSPFTFGKVTVKNRIELTPTGYMLANADGTANIETLRYYERIAMGGVGIITIGESAIDFEYADNHKPAINMGHDAAIPGLFRINEAVSKYGAKLSIELQHSGNHVVTAKKTIGPSAIPPADPNDPDAHYCVEMDHEMIKHVVKNWADAAERCQKAGLEMVMLHGGHGHLLSQFVSPHSNHRTDEYGGSLENRARFVIEVLDAIHERCPGLAIEYRISGNELIEDGLGPDEVIEFAKLIQDKIDLLHVSAGWLPDKRTLPKMIQPAYYPHMLNVHLAERFKKELHVPITTVGSIHDMYEAEDIIASGKADIVAMGRAIYADNDIVNKAMYGLEDTIRPCLRCFNCNKRTTRYLPIRCAVNPELGRREILGDEPKPAKYTKKLVVVGGGPGGIRSAIVAAQRGINVVLFEKSNVLGGNLIYASALDIKGDMREYVQWLRKTVMSTPNVEVRLNTEATRELVIAENPDAIIIAGGSTPILPKFKGTELNNVLWVGDAYNDLSRVGNKVVIIGGGNTGAESAYSWARAGKEVTVVDMQSGDVIRPSWTVGLEYLMEDEGVKFMFETGLSEITEKGCIVKKDGEEIELEADTIVLSLGFRPRKDLVEELSGIVPQTFVIGDNKRPDSSFEATHDGYNTAIILR